MKTVILSFSSRADGNCAQIGRLIQSLSCDAVLYDFSTFVLHPCGGCNYECFQAREKCPYIADMECEMLEAVTQSVMTWFILPNYCDYPCANFFAFNERSQCFFQGRPELLDVYLKVPKRSIVVSNTNTDHFVKALTYQVDQEPEILFLPAKKYGKVSIKGDLLTDEKVIQAITAFVNTAL